MKAMNVSRLGRSLGRGLFLCLLGGVLATGCRPSEPPEEKPDAGMTGPDAGTTEPDAGTTEPDAGSAGPDAGTADPDAGTTEPDAGLVLADVAVASRTPNLMLLVDTSGSMTNPVDPSLPACRPGGTVCGFEPPCDTSVCPTRWSELQAAMQEFLSTNGSRLRMGLATYPSNATCGSTTSLSVPLPAADQDDETTLVANAERVKNKLLSIKNYSTTEPMPQGGTPTSSSLRFVGERPELQGMDREDLVLLLTDGLPNCNESFPDPYPSAGCFCTLSSCSFSAAAQIGCLDKDAAVAAAQSLRSKEIKTIVMGFGSEFMTSTESGRRGAETLNGMADQGGFARTCTQHSDCGTGDTCDMSKGLCNRRFYPASNRTELSAALQGVIDRVRNLVCLLPLTDPEAYTQEVLGVSVDGVELAPGESTWSLTSEGVRFAGIVCEQLQAATREEPVHIVVRLR